MAFSPAPEGALVAFCAGQRLSLMRMGTSERETVSVGSVWSWSFSRDGRTLACGQEHGERVELYEIPSLTHVGTLEGSRGPVPNVSFSSDDQTLAIPCWGGFVQLWNRKVNAEVGRLPLPTDWMISARFSPDGNTLAVSGLGTGVHLFHAPTFEEISGLVESER